MATGTGGGLLGTAGATSVFKHKILDSYIAPFVSKVGSQAEGRRVMVVDGFAGRGRFYDDRPASAEHFLRVAEQREPGVHTLVRLYEINTADFTMLQSVTDEYRGRGVDAIARNMDVRPQVDEVLREASGIPLFLFLDPCGATLPFADLVRALTTSGRDKKWPPTEVLINFSADFTRRIGGALAKGVEGSGGELMDRVVGGRWWRERAIEEHARSADGTWGSAADAVAEEYGRRLGAAAGMGGAVTPVRRKPENQPTYHLVYLTRSEEGLWVMAGAIARARQEWLRFVGPQADDDELALFSVGDQVGELIDQEQEECAVRVRGNVLDLTRRLPTFRPVDHTLSILGDDYGTVAEKTVTAVLRDLVSEKKLFREPGQRAHQARFTLLQR